jgi:hypothetical protein
VISLPLFIAIIFSTFILNNYQVEEDEVGGTCGTNGREEESVLVIGRKARGKETPRKTKAYIRFEVITAVTMKNGVFWVVTSCGSCKNRRFG